MGCGDGSQGGTMGLVLLAEMEGCGWGSHRDGAVVNLRAGRCGSHCHGDAAGITYPVRAVCKQVLLLHTSTVWEECWVGRLVPLFKNPTAARCSSFQESEKLPENLFCPRRAGRGPGRVAAAPCSATPSHRTSARHRSRRKHRGIFWNVYLRRTVLGASRIGKPAVS